MPLSDHIRTALVTGAGSGLGEAFAAMLRTEGVRVWGTARDPARLVSQPNFFPVHLELGDRESVLAAWQRAESESGGIDLLVNNAGAALFVAGEASDVRAGIARAASAIDDGSAAKVLAALVSASNREAVA